MEIQLLVVKLGIHYSIFPFCFLGNFFSFHFLYIYTKSLDTFFCEKYIFSQNWKKFPQNILFPILPCFCLNWFLNKTNKNFCWKQEECKTGKREEWCEFSFSLTNYQTERISCGRGRSKAGCKVVCVSSFQFCNLQIPRFHKNFFDFSLKNYFKQK